MQAGGKRWLPAQSRGSWVPAGTGWSRRRPGAGVIPAMVEGSASLPIRVWGAHGAVPQFPHRQHRRVGSRGCPTAPHSREGMDVAPPAPHLQLFLAFSASFRSLFSLTGGCGCACAHAAGGSWCRTGLPVVLALVLPNWCSKLCLASGRSLTGHRGCSRVPEPIHALPTPHWAPGDPTDLHVVLGKELCPAGQHGNPALAGGGLCVGSLEHPGAGRQLWEVRVYPLVLARRVTETS